MEVSGVLGEVARGYQILRTDDGRVDSLLGQREGFLPGDRLQVVASPLEISYCQQGTPLAVIEVHPAGK